jgi:hypothetical protein
MKQVKFHGTKIISGKATNIKKVIYDVRSMQNIVEVERTEKDQITY